MRGPLSSSLTNDGFEVRFANDPNVLTFFDKLFRFTVLGTLFMPGQFSDVLVANHQKGRMLGYAIINLAACICSSDRCVMAGHRQHSGEYQDLTVQWSLRLCAGNISMRMYGLLNSKEPLFNAKAGLVDCKHQDFTCAPGILRSIASLILETECCCHICKPIPRPSELGPRSSDDTSCIKPPTFAGE